MTGILLESLKSGQKPAPLVHPAGCQATAALCRAASDLKIIDSLGQNLQKPFKIFVIWEVARPRHYP